jgi:PEGA domain
VSQSRRELASGIKEPSHLTTQSKRMVRGAWWAAGILAVIGWTGRVEAQPETPPSDETPGEDTAQPEQPVSAPVSEQDEKLEQAKELFRKGNALHKAGELQGALDMYQQSRAVVPSVPNTLNAAVMMDALGHFDQAQEVYELLLMDFGKELTDDERTSIGTALARLRTKVGSVDVAANVQGEVIIDGRKRAALPLTKPIRVLPGKHRVRVLKDGYNPAEAEVEVKAGATASIDLKLELLSSAGRLHVMDVTAVDDVEVLVDGSPVGPVPWEGMLKPGRHTLALRGKNVGTAPVEAIVVVGQTIEVELRSEPTGPEVVLVPTPATAVLTLGKVDLGPGTWRGNLPRKKFTVQAVAEGYHPGTVQVDGRTGGDVPIRLQVDENHPRWRTGESAKLRLEALGGFGFSSSLGSDAEADCPDGCARDGMPMGFAGGIRGAYVLPMGLQVEVGGGYMQMSAKLDQTVDVVGQSYVYEISHDMLLSGPYAGAGIRYGIDVGAQFRTTGGVTLGAWFAKSRDAASGRIVRGTETVDAVIQDAGASTRAVDFFVMPELGMEKAFGSFHVGLGLGLGIFLLDGPTLPNGETGPVMPAGAPSCADAPNALYCVSGSNEIAGDSKGYSRFLVWMPRVNVGWTL